MSRVDANIPLPVLTSTPPPRARRLRPMLLQLYRLAVLTTIVLLVHDHHTRLRLEGVRPVTLAEVRSVYPAATKLRADGGDRGGHHVLDHAGHNLGYVATTQPLAHKIVGYAGPTDGLLCFGPDGKLIRLIIRWSADTKEHVEDVASDRYFMKKLWPGRTWEELAAMDLQRQGVEGVSGATLTSMALAESVVYRTKWSVDRATNLPAVRFDAGEIGTLVLLVAACVLAFTHLRGITWLRRVFQVLVIGYIGFYSGNLLAQSLVAGWASGGVAWRLAPGLALLLAAALVIPWSTRRQIYCSYLCPHGAAQELAGKLWKKKLRLRHDVAAGLRWLPAGLLTLVILVTMLRLPFNLAAIEPFDAYLLTSAGVATIVVAVLGLVASVFIPQAYCKYGCPTGMLLEFVRSSGRADRFGRADLVAGLLLGLTLVLYYHHAAVTRWIEGA